MRNAENPRGREAKGWTRREVGEWKKAMSRMEDYGGNAKLGVSCDFKLGYWKSLGREARDRRERSQGRDGEVGVG